MASTPNSHESGQELNDSDRILLGYLVKDIKGNCKRQDGDAKVLSILLIDLPQNHV